MGIKKRIGLWFAVNRIIDTAHCDVRFSAPSCRFKQHRATAGLAEATPGAWRRLVPLKVVIALFQDEMVAFKANPGDKASAVRAPAHTAMAMCAPFAG
jgi:hypothetical protein